MRVRFSKSKGAGSIAAGDTTIALHYKGKPGSNEGAGEDRETIGLQGH